MEMGGLNGLKKGSWTEEEDQLLKKYVDKYGEGNWRHIPAKAAGLNRCRKSCRLRWLNYLRPNIKRGDFAVDEDDLIIRLHRLLGNRWSLIAGRIPGRTANDIKNYWNSYLSKKIASEDKNTSSSGNHWTQTSAMNLEPLEGEFESSSDQKQEGEDDEEEEEEDTKSFWRSLLLEGECMETKLRVENKEMKVEDEELFQGLEDLLQDMESLGGCG